jgi:integrase
MLLGRSKRRHEHADHTRSLPRRAIERQLSRRDVPLREKTLWRMLYETAARASEVLALDVERLDLANRRAPVRSKGRERSSGVHWGGTGTGRPET